jgi:hypothetical protein
MKKEGDTHISVPRIERSRSAEGLGEEVDTEADLEAVLEAAGEDIKQYRIFTS